MKTLCLLLLSVSVASFAQKGVKESVQFEKPPVIDGHVEDWSAEWWLDPDGKFLSNVGNDADNLYFRLKISDDLTQQKIGLFGLSVKLNPKGKRKGKVGLKYPVGKDKSEMKKENPEAGGKSAETDVAAKIAIKKEWVSDVEVVELIGLAKENIVSSRLGLANGIESMILAQDDGSYIYEAKIPFKAFRLKKSEIEVLGVEFETGRYAQQIKPAGSQGTGPAYGGQGYPGGGGSYRQPRYYASNFQYNALSSPGYIFLGVKLK